ncbi:Protein CBG23589 [Caenorhabditis briggsae]|uniref:Protein CBG23589 n=2 Tax=Caenorhabditis briggsae TaxID=6238 RepID=A8WIW4_CAEBR|nr:Protein CBG23589 [Caenorhabditis briggsae]ULT92404.1 hypothetical protein L3Y34_009884 [Caenorhabditis briggsae]CAP20408.2 Protein CBG23589 [Caenorhabditis briggsae]
MFHVQMEIHSFNSDLDLKKCAMGGPKMPEKSENSNGFQKLMDRALEEKRKGFRRAFTCYMFIYSNPSEKMFHVQMEIHSFNSDLDLKKCAMGGPKMPEKSENSNGSQKLMDHALEEKRKGFRRAFTCYM